MLHREKNYVLQPPLQLHLGVTQSRLFRVQSDQLQAKKVRYISTRNVVTIAGQAKRFFCYLIGVILGGTHLAVLRTYSWLCTQGQLLMVFRGSYRVPGIEPRLATGKVSVLSIMPSSGPMAKSFSNK